MLILDTSALFTMDAPPEEDYICPTGVLRELSNHNDPRLALWGDMLKTSDCSKESLERAIEASKKTGDDGRLSPMDLTVLALALDVNGTILSDDYSIQNTAHVLGLECRPVGTKGITKVAKWSYRCIGCGKWYKQTMPECPICGSALRACRRKRSREDALATDEIGHPALSENGHAHRSGGVGTEGEGIRQLLVEGRRLQRLLHDLAPSRIVTRKRGSRPDILRCNAPADPSCDHRQRDASAVDRYDLTCRIADNHSVPGDRIGDGSFARDELAAELGMDREPVLLGERIEIIMEIAVGELG